jgi:hypothetical protein
VAEQADQGAREGGVGVGVADEKVPGGSHDKTKYTLAKIAPHLPI